MRNKIKCSVVYYLDSSEIIFNPDEQFCFCCCDTYHREQYELVPFELNNHYKLFDKEKIIEKGCKPPLSGLENPLVSTR
jgi:hypothetical protein